DHHGPDRHVDRLRPRALGGDVHVAPPPVGGGTARPVRRAHRGAVVRRGVRTAPAVPARGRRGRGARHLLRDAHRAGLPVVRGQAGVARRVRGGDGRRVGRDQSRGGRRGGAVPDRARPPGAWVDGGRGGRGESR